MTEFTPVSSLLGGMLIGLSAVLLMAFNGRIAGVSGILAQLLPPWSGGDVRPQAAFVAGLLLAPLLLKASGAWTVVQTVSGNWPLLGLAGLLVGFGAAYGSGCTSGHGVCGLSRLSGRSIVATAVFMVSGIVTVLLVRHGLGG
jgi:uncharacterized membrane protein YedE/YeeE